MITDARATRILFSESRSSNGEVVAESVEYSKGGKIFLVSIKREVILAAGMTIVICQHAMYSTIYRREPYDTSSPRTLRWAWKLRIIAVCTERWTKESAIEKHCGSTTSHQLSIFLALGRTSVSSNLFLTSVVLQI